MCYMMGCDEPPKYIDDIGNHVCQACVTQDIKEGNAIAEHFKLIDPDSEQESIKGSSTIEMKAFEPSEDVEQIICDDVGKVEVLEIGAITEIAPSSLIPIDKEGVTIFFQDLTSERLEKLQTEINALPTVIDKTTFDITYKKHQVMKKFRQLLKTEVENKIKTVKFNSKVLIQKLNDDHALALGSILPMESQLLGARDWWDMLTAAHKENKARTQAAEDEKERDRIRLAKATQHRLEEESEEDSAILAQYLVDETEAWVTREGMLQDEETGRLEAAAMEIERASEKLEREKYEFACDKSRLSPDEALEEAYPSLWIEPDKCDETFQRENNTLDTGPLLTSDMFATSDHAGDLDEFAASGDIESNIDTKILEMETDLNAVTNAPEEKNIDSAGPSCGMIKSLKNIDTTDARNHDLDKSVIVCNNPEQGFIDEGRDEQSTRNVATITDDYLVKLNSLTFVDPKKQQKLSDLILNIQINYNSFKKGVK